MFALEMAKQCTNCVKGNSIIEEQKNKLQLLETRLKDLVRAYKVACKEKENLLNTNITDIDTKQQRRIAELEENVIHMSSLCGKFELERKEDKEKIAKLEALNDSLKIKLEESQDIPQITEVSKAPKTIEYKNKFCQTDVVEETNSTEDRCIQTEESDLFPSESSVKTKNETAVVPPMRHVSMSDSESVFSDDLNRSMENLHINPHIERSISVNSESVSVSNNGISLFYVNELARKEIEIAEYRLRVRELECSLRELQWKYTNDKYRLQSRIADLELLNTNFIASKSEDQNAQLNKINVAYIRNVLKKLLETKDREQKRLMINALLTALDSIQSN